MPTLAQIRKCVYPFPVYEAHFANNTVVRMSVWQPLGKPWDFASFRRGHRKMRGEIVDGYLEHDVPNQPWVRVQDPTFSGEIITAIRKRGPSAKQVKVVLKDVLAYLEGSNDETAIERARELLAA